MNLSGSLHCWIALSCVAVQSAAVADKADAPNPDTDLRVNLAAMNDGWRFDFQPYIWIPIDVDADATIKGVTAKVEVTIDEVLDQADVFGLLGRVEGWTHNWGFFIDGLYMTLDGEGFSAQAGPLTLSADAEIEMVMVDFGLGWRLLDEPIGDTGSEWPRLTIDALGGGRYQYLSLEISRATLPTLSDSRDWLDLLVGGRVVLRFSSGVAFAVRGDASGFGIGSGSNLTWNLGGGFDLGNYESLSVRLGYRILGMDFDTGSGSAEFGLDGTLHGPYLGFSIKF